MPPDIDLPKAPITHAKARTVPTGFLRNANDTNNGAADARNCSDPINPFRLTGFSKNLINPSIADPARNDDICNRNLPTLLKVLASLCIESGFLANQVNAANPAVAPFIKINKLISELAYSLDLDPDELLNDPEEAAIMAQIIGMQNNVGQATGEAAGPGGQEQGTMVATEGTPQQPQEL